MKDSYNSKNSPRRGVLRWLFKSPVLTTINLDLHIWIQDDTQMHQKSCSLCFRMMPSCAKLHSRILEWCTGLSTVIRKFSYFDTPVCHLKIWELIFTGTNVGNDRKTFFHFGQYRKGTSRELSISAGTVIPAEILSTGRNTLFRPKDVLSAKRHIQTEEESLVKHYRMTLFQPVSACFKHGNWPTNWGNFIKFTGRPLFRPEESISAGSRNSGRYDGRYNGR